MNEKKHLLDMQDVSIVFGGLRAVSNVNLYIDEGELIGLIGPNGAGKTTAFNMITGVYTPYRRKNLFRWQIGQRQKVVSGNANGYGPYLPEYPSFFGTVCVGQC